MKTNTRLDNLEKDVKEIKEILKPLEGRRLVVCPKCKYSWRTTSLGKTCCPKCKRYFRI